MLKVRPPFRPLSNHMLDVVTITLRRSPHLALITLVAWGPAAYELYMALTTAVRVPSLTGFLSQVDGAPTESLTGLVGDLAEGRTHAVLFVAAALVGLCLSTGAFAHQMYRSTQGAPASGLRSVVWAVGRLHRVLVAVLVLLVVLALPAVVFLAVAGYITWLDPTGWKAALESAWLISFFVGCLSVYLIGRLAPWPAAAALSPYLRFTWLAALRVSAARWWSVSWRLWPTALMTAAVLCAALAPVTVMMLLGDSEQMVIGLVAAFVALGAAASYVPATMALPFADSGQPSRALGTPKSTDEPKPDQVEAAPSAAPTGELPVTQDRLDLAAYAAQRLADLR